jgi:Luciferase-like monooxygenase
MTVVSGGRVALYLQDKHPLREGIAYVRQAEACGFEAVWQAESRLVREATVPMAAFAAVTRRIKVGAGVIPIWTRNVGLLAATFATLDELAPGRVLLGLGARWEPLPPRSASTGAGRCAPCARSSRRPAGCWRWSGSPTTASSSTSTAWRSTSSTATGRPGGCRSTSARPACG